MKKGFVDGDRAVVANDQTAIVAEPSEGAFDVPTTPVTPQGSTILRARLAAIPAMRRDQFNASRCQLRAQRISIAGPLTPAAALQAATINGARALKQTEQLYVDQAKVFVCFASTGVNAPGTMLPNRSSSGSLRRSRERQW